MSHITDQEISDLKNEVEAKKRQVEYDRLKQDLADITYKVSHTPTEFDSAMTYPDTDKVLKSKDNQSFLNSAIDRFTHMLSPRPITGNLIALGILLAVLLIIRLNAQAYYDDNDIRQYLPYIGYLALGAGAIQILKSSTRSLLIPVVATAVGLAIATSMNVDDVVFTFQQTVYQGMFIVGLIGLIIGAFTID